jgi:hypothetical protein
MNSWPRLIPLVLLFAGCDGGVPVGPDGHVTLASLPQEDRDRFDHWKDLVVKDCAWEQAFPSLAEEFPPPSGERYVPVGTTVDMRALLASNGGSPLVTGADGQLVLLGTPLVDQGFETDKRSMTSSIGGRTRVFDISANRENGVCVVTLDGEELYRADMPRAVPVVVATDRNALARPGIDLPPLLESAPGVDDPAAAIDGATLLLNTTAALTPTFAVYGFLATRFESSDAVVRQRFPLSAERAADVVRIAASAAPPFAPRATLYGPRASLAPIYDGTTLQLELLYRRVGADLLSLHVALAIDAGGKNVRTTAVTAAAPVAYSDAAATSCFVGRGVARQFESNQARSPAFTDQFAGCDALAADGYAALAGDATLRQAIAAQAILPGRPPAAPYRGWDRALIEVAQRLDEQAISLHQLDPSGSIAALSPVIDRRDTLLAAITDPTAHKAFGRPLIALSFGWLFSNLQPSPALIATIESALSHTAVDYSESTRTMLDDLAGGVDAASRGAQAARCGMELVGERKAAIDRALVAAAQVPFADDFAAAERAGILQSCPTSDAIAQLEASIPAVRDFVTADEPRASSAALYAFSIEPLVSHALEERWTATTFTQVADLVGFALVSEFTYCDTKPSSAEQIDCIDRPLDFFTAAGGGVLSVASAGRYAALARDLTARWPGLSSSQYFTSRFDIGRAFFDTRGLWRSCDNAGFARSAARLDTLIENLEAATTFDQRFDIEDQITTLVGASTCP